jgi:heat shock protein HslJ
LTLSGDGTANLQTDQLNGDPIEEETGTWAANDAISLTVTLTGTEDIPAEALNVITFTLSGTQLTAIEFSQPERYGTAGLQLQKVASDSTSSAPVDAPPADLTGATWQLTRVISTTGSAVGPDDSSKYTVAFGDDWRVTVKADCNQGGGPYEVQDRALKIGPLISTLAACPDGSLSEGFLNSLGIAESYSITDGVLSIGLANDGGALEFTTAQ